MRLVQFLLLSWSLTSIVWADDDDDDDLNFDDDTDSSEKADDGGGDDEDEKEDEDDSEEEEDGEDDFDAQAPETQRYQQMNRCYDIVKTSITKETLNHYVEQLKKDGGVSEEMDEDKAKAAIMLDTTFSCYCNVFLDETLWAKAKLPLSVYGAEQKQELFGALFQKDEKSRPKISKKQSAMLQQILMPPKVEKRLSETDEERAARKERMKQRAEERAANKGKEKKEKKRSSGGPQLDLPGGLLSMSSKNSAIYVAIVLGAISLILLLGVRKLISYQEESNEMKQAKKDKKESRKKK